MKQEWKKGTEEQREEVVLSFSRKRFVSFFELGWSEVEVEAGRLDGRMEIIQTCPRYEHNNISSVAVSNHSN